MSPAWLLLLAAMAAGPGAPDGERVAQALPGAVLLELGQGLPPPPASVVRVTERYGTVTLDHQRHLELRASCRRCHGQGPVSTIRFTARTAHERCIGCHQERSAGPVHCAGCHVKTVAGDGAARLVSGGARTKEEAKAAAATLTGAATAGQPGAPASAAPAAAGEPTAGEPAVARTVAAQPAAGEPAAARTDASGPTAARTVAATTADLTAEPPVEGGAALTLADALTAHRVEAGLAAGPGLGFSLRVSSHGGRLATAYSFDRLGRPGSTHMLGLVGAGLAIPLRERLALVALAVGGFDAEERPRLGLSASGGARVGVEWAPPPAFVVRSVGLSVTAVADLTSLGVLGHHRGGGRIFATLGLGLSPPGRAVAVHGAVR